MSARECYVHGIRQYDDGDWLFITHVISLRFIQVVCYQYFIPFYCWVRSHTMGYIAGCLTIYPLKDIWGVSSFWQLWTFMYKFLHENKRSSGISAQECNYWVLCKCILSFERKYQTISGVAVPFYTPMSQGWVMQFSIPSPASAIVTAHCLGHFERYVVTSHCGLTHTSLLDNDAEHRLMNLFTVCLSSSVKWLWVYFAHF